MSKRYRVRWAPVAIEDIVVILTYLQQQSPDLSERLFRKLQRRAESLDRFPERGRIVPELRQIGVHFLRELVIPPYRLLYRIDHEVVHVLSVFDGRRNLEDLLLERAIRII